MIAAAPFRAVTPRLIRPMLLAAGLIAAGLLLRPAFRMAPEDLAGAIGGGGRGAAILLVGGALLCAVGLPRQMIAFAGAYLFGLWRGGVLALLAQGLGCIVSFYWARFVARDWAQRRLRGKLDRVDRFLSAEPFTATLMLRLLPVGNNLALNLLAGISRLALAPFLAASMLGYIPQTAIFALLGSGVRVNRAWQLGLGGALFGVSALCGAWLLRRRFNGSLATPRSANPPP